MPEMDPEIQKVLWKLGDALAKALRAPSSDAPGDPQWRVQGVESRVWGVNHPDLPIVRDEEGDKKEVLLQLHLTTDGETGQWLVVAQNKVVGPESNSSPKALIVAAEEESPGSSWDVESIAEASANFFKKQKNDLQEQAQAITPQFPPGAIDTAPAPAPIASRRSKLAAQIRNAE